MNTKIKKILTSFTVIAVLVIAVVVGTNAFFSDTEISTGNTFQAGAIDLLISNESYGFDWNRPGVVEPVGAWGPNSANSWNSDDLTDQLFFSFEDLKPGDYGEDTIDLVVRDNDAWACMAFDLTGTPENSQNEPEALVDATAGADEGELQNYLSFLFWYDDGDNVLEVGEEVIDELSGLPGTIFSGNWLAIADTSNEESPLPGGTTHYIGKGWCFGTLTPNPAPVADNPEGPTPGNTGFTCDGTGDHNDAQTDGIVVDVGFHAVQSRHNDEFLCSSLPPFGGGEQRPLVGGAFATYVDPVDDPADECDATVDTTDSLQAAVDAATDGQTICVDPTYNGTGDAASVIEVNKTNLTIAGLGVSGAATVNKGLHVDANGVTIKGLTLNSYPLIESSENAAVYINSAITGTTISHNQFVPMGDAKAANAKGVITEIGNSGTPGASGVLVEHNLFQSWNQGMFFNTANVEVRYNDIFDNNVGVANDGPHSSSIHHNDFEDNDSEAVGVAPSATNGTANDGVLTVNLNNFAPAGAGNNVNHYLVDHLPGADVNAENNWWDGEAEAARTNDTAEVDTEPAEVAAFPEN